MSFSKFLNAEIKGVAITLGENRNIFEDEPVFYNNDKSLLKRLKKTIGFGTRFTANKETTTCDLCLDAASRLLSEMQIAPKSIDAVISVTQTPDYYMPGNAHIVHERLKMSKDTVALDVELGCSGFIYGLWLSYMMVETGLQRVLLLTGDTLSKTVHPEDRTEAPLFGDAGSATLIERAKASSQSFFILKSDGTGVPNMLQPAGAYRNPSSEETRVLKSGEDGSVRCDEHIYMNGFEIFNFTLTEQPEMLDQIFAASSKTVEDIDFFLFHQGNKYIVDTLAKSAKLPSHKVPVIFQDYGNQNSASIPGVICTTLLDELKGAKKQVVMQGFGIGLSWGVSQLELNDVTILKPHVYREGINE